MPKCETCGREFDTGRGLTVHSRIHDNPEPYQNKDELERLYWHEKMSQREIADKLDTNVSNIDTWMKKLGVEKRDKSESAKMRGMPEELIETGAPKWVYDDMRKSPANLTVGPNGHLVWRVFDNGTYHAIGVHRLVAIANGADIDKIFSNGEHHVHHKNGIPWDNRSENLELMSKSEHHSLHNDPKKELVYNG